MNPCQRSRSERIAILLADHLSNSVQVSDPKQWVLLNRLTDRIERWVSTRPTEIEAWRSCKATPRPDLAPLADLLSRLVLDDIVARHLIDNLVPKPPICLHEVEYQDLVVAFEPDGADSGSVSVRILEAPYSRLASVRLNLKALASVGMVAFTTDRYDERGIRRARPAHQREATAREVGMGLFKALFQGGLRDAWVAHRSVVAVRPDLGVRLRLAFDLRNKTVRSVAALPWELLHDPEQGLPLCKSVHTPVVRSLATVKHIRRNSTLMRHVLLLRSRPIDEISLNVEMETRAIINALRGVRGARVDVADADLDQLRASHKGKRSHVIHFMGHGEFDSESQEGQLVFEELDGLAWRVSAKTFVEQLVSPELELVVLSACCSGENVCETGSDPFSGVAASLLEAGVPAVVAMQRPISDLAAIQFTAAFYETLANGSPLSAAVTEGRLAISGHDPKSVEWATPALYVGGS